MTQTESSCSCSVKLVQHVLDCLGLLLIIVLQGSILDYYLILHNGGNAAWYFWFLADFLILIAFMAAAVISYRYYRKKVSNSYLFIKISNTIYFNVNVFITCESKTVCRLLNVI